MLKKIPRSELREGVRFSAPVFFDDGENMLVCKGAPIKQRELKALDSCNISYVLTAGRPLSAHEVIQDGPVDDLAELDDTEEIEDIIEVDDYDEELHQSGRTTGTDLGFTPEQILKLPEVIDSNPQYQSYLTVIRELHSLFDTVRTGLIIEGRAIDRLVYDLINLIDSDRAGMVGFILGGDVEDMDVAKSAINTAILAVLICEHMMMPRHRLVQIATAAVLHDIGMLKVPKPIIDKEGKLDDTEIQAMRAHTSYGYKTIVKEMMYADEVGKAAAQHHERWDGEGYPTRLAGAAIDVGARIISVADAFEAMVSPKSYRNALIGYDAMKNLLSDNARRFDPDIIKAMIQSFGIYPIGSIVLMNNSVIARVIEANSDAPLRPRIRILIDEFAKAFPSNTGEVIDLQDTRSMFITQAINSREYRTRA